MQLSLLSTLTKIVEEVEVVGDEKEFFKGVIEGRELVSVVASALFEIKASFAQAFSTNSSGLMSL